MKIPKKIKVIKSFYCNKFRKLLKINKGEIGEYFEHTDVYTFDAREGYVPYIERDVAIRNNLHFEKLSDEQV